MLWIKLKSSRQMFVLITVFHVLAGYVLIAYMDLMPLIVLSWHYNIWRLVYAKHSDDIQIILCQHGVWQIKTQTQWHSVDLAYIQNIGVLFLCFKQTSVNPANNQRKRFITFINQDRIGDEFWRKLQVAIRMRKMV